jgi:uncharacterized protein (TIGR02596 family)
MRFLDQRVGRRKFSEAFSLVEMMVVLGIIGILSLFSLAAYSRIIHSASLSSATQLLSNALELARQTAITRDCNVEFRLYQLPDDNAGATTAPIAYRAFQMFLTTDNSTNAFTKISYLPNPEIISPSITVSSMATMASVPGVSFTQGTTGSTTPQTLPVYGTRYNAIPFRFSPSGSLVDASHQLDDTKQWFLTLVSKNDPPLPTGLPKNYATIQLDPFSGRVTVYRP